MKITFSKVQNLLGYKGRGFEINFRTLGRVSTQTHEKG